MWGVSTVGRNRHLQHVLELLTWAPLVLLRGDVQNTGRYMGLVVRWEVWSGDIHTEISVQGTAKPLMWARSLKVKARREDSAWGWKLKEWIQGWTLVLSLQLDWRVFESLYLILLPLPSRYLLWLWNTYLALSVRLIWVALFIRVIHPNHRITNPNQTS